MGFFDLIKEGAGVLLESAKESAEKRREEIEDYRRRYESYDDYKLLEMYRTGGGSVTRKMAIASLLRDRGYGNSDLDDN